MINKLHWNNHFNPLSNLNWSCLNCICLFHFPPSLPFLKVFFLSLLDGRHKFGRLILVNMPTKLPFIKWKTYIFLVVFKNRSELWEFGPRMGDKNHTFKQIKRNWMRFVTKRCRKLEFIVSYWNCTAFCSECRNVMAKIRCWVTINGQLVVMTFSFIFTEIELVENEHVVPQVCQQYRCKQ